MERHIGEAARSANAMEDIVDTIRQGNQQVMRAYLTVTVGAGIYQERRGQGQADLKFEARPNLINTGATPARKVRVKIKADILPVPIPKNHDFSLPENELNTGDDNVGAHQTYIMCATVDDFVPDENVQNIKEGIGKGLYVWGTVKYDDIFGSHHDLKFGQLITWQRDNSLFVNYISGQNDSD